jgi:hypothetical protein
MEASRGEISECSAVRRKLSPYALRLREMLVCRDYKKRFSQILKMSADSDCCMDSYYRLQPSCCWTPVYLDRLEATVVG